MRSVWESRCLLETKIVMLHFALSLLLTVCFMLLLSTMQSLRTSELTTKEKELGVILVFIFFMMVWVGIQ